MEEEEKPKMSTCWICKGIVYHEQPFGEGGRLLDDDKTREYVMTVSRNFPKICPVCIMETYPLINLFERIYRERGEEESYKVTKMVINTAKRYGGKAAWKLVENIDNGLVKEFKEDV